MEEGDYRMVVHNYSASTCKEGFTAQIEFEGQSFDFPVRRPIRGKEYIEIAKVRYSKIKGFSIVSSIDQSEMKIQSRSKWGVKTNQFQKVKTVTLSPNHWDGATGNKHYFFFLDGCVAEESPRPFYNEFLPEELLAQKRVFELMGSKLKVEPNPDQLSGLGFSDTQRAHLYVRVTGAFQRILKVKF
jgi:hypothetical protein